MSHWQQEEDEQCSFLLLTKVVLLALHIHPAAIPAVAGESVVQEAAIYSYIISLYPASKRQCPTGGALAAVFY